MTDNKRAQASSAAPRTACVEAINDFHRQHPLVGVLVCSRTADYDLLHTRLQLQMAVLVQPLTRQQASDYLQSLGRPLAGVRAALRDDPQLWELLATPLWLSIVTLAYQGQSPQQLRGAATADERRRTILSAYIQAMLARRSREARYTPRQTIHWLAWLARQMAARSQTVFLIEQLQRDWLGEGRMGRLYAIIAVLIFGLGVGLAGGLFFGLVGGLVGGLVFGLVFGLVGGLGAGLFFGLSGDARTVAVDAKTTPNQGVRQSAKYAILTGLVGGLVAGLVGGLVFGLYSGLICGGEAAIKHGILRFFLWRQGCMPWHYARFLNACVDRIFLRRAGGGYLFTHRLLLDHFAHLTPIQIQQIAAALQKPEPP
jgi:hypothetical protein